MRHTLKEYFDRLQPTTIQLLYGDHIVNIDTRAKGSAALYRAFKNEKYYFKRYSMDHLVLDYSSEDPR